MKHRKPPYVLGGLIAVFLCAVVFIGIHFAKTAVDPEKPAPPEAPDNQVGQSRETPSPDLIVKKFAPAKQGPQGPGKAMDQLPPSILNPKVQGYKPHAGDSETGSLGPAR